MVAVCCSTLIASMVFHSESNRLVFNIRLCDGPAHYLHGVRFPANSLFVLPSPVLGLGWSPTPRFKRIVRKSITCLPQTGRPSRAFDIVYNGLDWSVASLVQKEI